MWQILFENQDNLWKKWIRRNSTCKIDTWNSYYLKQMVFQGENCKLWNPCNVTGTWVESLILLLSFPMLTVSQAWSQTWFLSKGKKDLFCCRFPHSVTSHGCHGSQCPFFQHKLLDLRKELLYCWSAILRTPIMRSKLLKV